MLTADRFISARFRWIATASRATWAPGRAWFAAANGAARKKTTAPRTAEATTGSARTRLSGRCFLPRRVDHERVDARLDARLPLQRAPAQGNGVGAEQERDCDQTDPTEARSMTLSSEEPRRGKERGRTWRSRGVAEQ